MTYGLWLSTGGLQVNEYRQAVLANNLANADTPGFKEDLAVFRERSVESLSGGRGRRFAHATLDDLSGGTWVRPTVQTYNQGVLEDTGNGYDLALWGDGFFSVQDGAQVRYTRDGRTTLTSEGELVMVAGGGRARVLDTQGQPIVIDSRGGPVSIQPDGTIQQDGAVIAQIGVAHFADRSQLTKLGENLYQNFGPPPTVAESQVRSGFVERSTVDPVVGLAQLIEVSRAYQLNANLISLQDQTLGQAVNTVGRIG